jgi:multiple antibiotic resistance protein
MDFFALGSLAFTLFLLMDPIGNVPFYISFLKEIDPKRQRYVIFREMVVALIIIIFFNFLGEGLLRFLSIDQETIRVSGGIILFLLSLKMIFPPNKDPSQQEKIVGEPFIVPLAVPLVAGPSVLAAVIIYSNEVSTLLIVGAIVLAWCISLLILLASPTLKNWLGNKGLIACERLMGLILTFMAVQMFLSGVSGFLKNAS